MTRNEILERVVAILEDKLDVLATEITEESYFESKYGEVQNLGADSLDKVKIIMEFEREFKINIPNDESEKLETVGQAVNYIYQNKC